MKTISWIHDVVDPAPRDAYLFTYWVGAEIAQAIVRSGGSLDWSSHLYTTADGSWRQPTPAELAANGRLYSFQASDPDSDLVRAASGTPHGWAHALKAGLHLTDGDRVRIELSCFDSGRHMLEGWVKMGDRQRSGASGSTVYSAIAHLPQANSVLGRELTREQVRDLVADPAAVLPPQPQH